MKAEITRTMEESQIYGKITKIELPNKSKIYITKKGWNLVAPDGKEINIPYGEINLAINETIIAGYIDDEKHTRCQYDKDCKNEYFRMNRITPTHKVPMCRKHWYMCNR